MAGSNKPPCARRVQANGLTTTVRKKFLERLALTANVSLAAASVHKCRSSLYRLREREPAFAAAWDSALDEAMDDVFALVIERIRTGTEREVYYQGKQCGTVRTYPTAAAVRLLAMYRPTLHRKLVDAKRPTFVAPPFEAVDKLLAEALRRPGQ